MHTDSHRMRQLLLTLLFVLLALMLLTRPANPERGSGAVHVPSMLAES